MTTLSGESLLPDDEMSRLVFFEYIDESMDALQQLDHRLIDLERHPDDLSAINTIFRPVHSIKGNSAFFGMLKVKKLAHELENILDQLRKGLRPLNRDVIELLLQGFDALRSMFERVRAGGAEVDDEAAFKALLERVEAVVSSSGTPSADWSHLVEELDRLVRKVKPGDRQVVQEVERLISRLRVEAVDAPPDTRAPAPPSAPTAPPQSDAPTPLEAPTRKTLRIAEEQLDSFLAYVGELIVVGEMFHHLHEQMAAQTDDLALVHQFRYVNETFSDLSTDLQRAIMSMRQLPLKPLLEKAHRLVRDVASQLGKEIETHAEDNGLMADKRLIDLLDAPLTHLLRNAADHGIEMPDKRVAAGKPTQGHVYVTAQETDEQLLIEVRDDGAGIDRDAIAAKARAMGILGPQAEATWEDVVKFLFMSGISTQKEVTDISGRGVGMDVVKREIEAAGGVIRVESTLGQGSRFSISLPKSVTTQILRGFLVAVNGITFVLPMEAVEETTRIPAKDITWIKGKDRCMQRHGNILPLHHLSTLLDLDAASDQQEHTVVIVQVNEKRQALIIDELVGVQQVVVKPINGLEGWLAHISGGALMGNGEVALVLNLASL